VPLVDNQAVEYGLLEPIVEAHHLLAIPLGPPLASIVLSVGLTVSNVALKSAARACS
jgi:hypothetical protein